MLGYRDVLKDVVVEEVGDADWLFELPIEYGGTLDQNAVAAKKDSLMAFDIKTGAKAAQEQFDKK